MNIKTLQNGWLVIFDRRTQALPIEERLAAHAMQSTGQRDITVIRA